MNIDLVCLGVGKGATYVTKGWPSTAFAILIEGEPKILIDAGAGIALSCQRHLGKIPGIIYITHNHMDHTGDLPILIGCTDARPGKPHILGHPEVLEIVRTHRLHDPATNVNEQAEWIVPNKSGLIPVGWDLYIKPIKTKHTYTCYGFVLKLGKQDIWGYSADSPYDENLFTMITKPPIAVIDARDKATYDHSSFEEIEGFARKVPDCSIWLVHYEQTKFQSSVTNMNLMYEGQRIRLFDPKGK